MNNYIDAGRKVYYKDTCIYENDNILYKEESFNDIIIYIHDYKNNCNKAIVLNNKGEETNSFSSRISNIFFRVLRNKNHVVLIDLINYYGDIKFIIDKFEVNIDKKYFNIVINDELLCFNNDYELKIVKWNDMIIQDNKYCFTNEIEFTSDKYIYELNSDNLNKFYFLTEEGYYYQDENEFIKCEIDDC